MIEILFADNDLCQRRGKVMATEVLIKNNPVSAMLLASQVVIMGVEKQENGIIVWSGYSYHFDKLKFNEEAPFYSVVKEGVMIKFVRV